MLRGLIRSIAQRPTKSGAADESGASVSLRLHIGGITPHPDWKVLNVAPGAHVDFVGTCTDLSRFADSSVAEIYASHVLEHLSYQSDLPKALAEFHRVLTPGGMLHASVPDLTTLCSLFLEPALTASARYHVMRMMFGGQVDAADFHHVGLTEEFLSAFLRKAGFEEIRRVEALGIFDDMSRTVYEGRQISLNVVARKPANDVASAAARKT